MQTLNILQELLELVSPDKEILFEFLGNLDFIDKKFKPLLKHYGKQEYRHNKKNTFRKSTSFSQALGQDSIVKDQIVKTSADIDKMLKGDNDLQILVLETQGVQFAFIRKYTWSAANTWSQTPTPGEYRYEFFVDTDYLLEHTSEESEVAFHSITQKMKFIETHSFDIDPSKIQIPLTDTQLYGQITGLMKALKETDLHKKEIKAYSVFTDTRRLVTAQERKTARTIDTDANKILLQKQPGKKGNLDDNAYSKFVKDRLSERLAAFKLDRTGNLDNVEDLIELVKKKGFEKFIKIKGLTYKLDTMNYLSADNFMNPEKNTRYVPNVEYKVDDESPEWEAWKTKGRRMKDLFDVDTPEGEQEYHAAYRAYLPPRSIKLALALGPGGIVVKGIMPRES